MSSKSAEVTAGLRGSLRLHLTALFALVTSATIGLVGLFLGWSLSMQLDASERDELRGKLEQLQHHMADIPDRKSIGAYSQRFADVLIGHRDIRSDVLDESGTPLVALSSFAWPSQYVARAAAGHLSEEVLSSEDGLFHMMLAPAELGSGGGRVVVAVAHDRAQTGLLLSRFRESIVLACIIASALAGGLGYFAARRGLAPLGRLVNAAQRISAERLGERLDVRAVPQELGALAGSFNDMLARLGDSFRRMSQYSADLAHELRTPIGNLMLQTQIALEKPRSEPELREALESGLEELQRLSRMVNDMLFLAKADHTRMALNREPLRLEEEVDKVLEFYEPLATERGVTLARHGSAAIRADRGMMRRLIANLLSNAVRHGKPGSTVEVRLTPAGRTVDIAVLNEGTPVPVEELGRVFDRFYRGRVSNGAEGAGLGLSIVKSIAELHGGTVAAHSAGGRTMFSAKIDVDQIATGAT
jgi:two-component system, OmpR family, heavy metal sensor histidine kinase CusS